MRKAISIKKETSPTLNPNTIKSYKILQKLSPKHAAHGVAQSTYPNYRHGKACLSKQPPWRAAGDPRLARGRSRVRAPGPAGALRALFFSPLPSFLLLEIVFSHLPHQPRKSVRVNRDGRCELSKIYDSLLETPRSRTSPTSGFRRGSVSRNSASTRWGRWWVSPKYTDQKCECCWIVLTYFWWSFLLASSDFSLHQLEFQIKMENTFLRAAKWYGRVTEYAYFCQNVIIHHYFWAKV